MRTFFLRLRCLFTGHHSYGAPYWLGRFGFVRCAECGHVSDGITVPRMVLKVKR